MEHESWLPGRSDDGSQSRGYSENAGDTVPAMLRNSDAGVAAAATTPIRVHSCLPSRNHMKAGSLVVNELRQASNKGTLRAFRYANRFTTFKIFRRPGALRRRLAPGQSRRSD